MKRNKLLLISLFVLSGFLTSVSAADFEVKIGNAIHNKKLPSASGMTAWKNKYFVVGDDSPYLYTVDKNFTISGKFLLKDFPVEKNGRIKKNIKPDYEAMSLLNWQGKTWNMIIGSGSKADVRETAYLLAMDESHKKIEQDLSQLYREFVAKANFTDNQTLNIEALAVTGDKVYFFNRGNPGRNIIFQTDLKDVMAYMTGKEKSLSNIKKHEVLLPEIDGVKSGFSGAELWPQLNSLVYTASVENSDSAYADGKILGSFIGLIPLASLQNEQVIDLRSSAQLITKQGKAVLTKVESLSFLKTDQNRATGALVSDNDDGSSVFFNVTLIKK
jgi:hypothetical protein